MQADARGDEPKTCDEFAERRREFLAALGDNTAPVQPPITDANGMQIVEPLEGERAEDLSLLPLAAGAEGLAERRPLSRKERKARQRLLEKLRRKAK
jgi:hypothetical protein